MIMPKVLAGYIVVCLIHSVWGFPIWLSVSIIGSAIFICVFFLADRIARPSKPERVYVKRRTKRRKPIKRVKV